MRLYKTRGLEKKKGSRIKIRIKIARPRAWTPRIIIISSCSRIMRADFPRNREQSTDPVLCRRASWKKSIDSFLSKPPTGGKLGKISFDVFSNRNYIKFLS